VEETITTGAVSLPPVPPFARPRPRRPPPRNVDDDERPPVALPLPAPRLRPPPRPPPGLLSVTEEFAAGMLVVPLDFVPPSFIKCV
jgi:hypothetical protein